MNKVYTKPPWTTPMAWKLVNQYSDWFTNRETPSGDAAWLPDAYVRYFKDRAVTIARILEDLGVIEWTDKDEANYRKAFTET